MPFVCSLLVPQAVAVAAFSSISCRWRMARDRTVSQNSRKRTCRCRWVSLVLFPGRHSITSPPVTAAILRCYRALVLAGGVCAANEEDATNCLPFYPVARAVHWFRRPTARGNELAATTVATNSLILSKPNCVTEPAQQRPNNSHKSFSSSSNRSGNISDNLLHRQPYCQRNSSQYRSAHNELHSLLARAHTHTDRNIQG